MKTYSELVEESLSKYKYLLIQDYKFLTVGDIVQKDGNKSFYPSNKYMPGEESSCWGKDEYRLSSEEVHDNPTVFQDITPVFKPSE